MKILSIALVSTAAALAVTLPVASRAGAEVVPGGCVTHIEFDNTTTGETPVHVANRYDTYGVFLDDTQSTYRRGYDTCWAPAGRQAVVVFSYGSGTSVDWYVRDI